MINENKPRKYRIKKFIKSFLILMFIGSGMASLMKSHALLQAIVLLYSGLMGIAWGLYRAYEEELILAKYQSIENAIFFSPFWLLATGGMVGCFIRYTPFDVKMIIFEAWIVASLLLLFFCNPERFEWAIRKVALSIGAGITFAMVYSVYKNDSILLFLINFLVIGIPCIIFGFGYEEK